MSGLIAVAFKFVCVFGIELVRSGLNGLVTAELNRDTNVNKKTVL